MKKPPAYHLHVRTYQDTPFVRVLLCGGGQSFLWGEVLPDVAEEIIQATGLPVERDEAPYQAKPMKPPECTPVAEQKSLFA